jgi:hypothetical protein
MIVLACRYEVEIGVVSCESFSILHYGTELPSKRGRIYILYTGQHYDPFIVPGTPEVSRRSR